MNPYREPSDSPSPKPPATYLRVNTKSRLNLRRWPGMHVPILKVLDYDERVELMDLTENEKSLLLYGKKEFPLADAFVKVRAWFPSGEVEGWALREFLTEEQP